MKASRTSFLFFLLTMTGLIYVFRDAENTSFQNRLLSLDESRIPTTSSRLPIVDTYCKQNATPHLITDDQKSTNKQYFSIMQSYFKTDLTSFIGYVLNGQMDILET